MPYSGLLYPDLPPGMGGHCCQPPGLLSREHTERTSDPLYTPHSLSTWLQQPRGPQSGRDPGQALSRHLRPGSRQGWDCPSAGPPLPTQSCTYKHTGGSGVRTGCARACWTHEAQSAPTSWPTGPSLA